MMNRLRDVVKNLETEFDAKAYLDRFPHVAHESDDWLLTCPVCEKEKLYVTIVQKRDPDRPPGTWICFLCDQSGSPSDLIRLLDSCSFFAAIEILKKFSRYVEREVDLRTRVEKLLTTFEPDPEEPLQECALPEEFILYRDAQRVPSYFDDRGISREDALRHRLGFCAQGHYKNRLIVPVYQLGRLIWFLGRWMAPKPPPGVKKYLNSAASPASKTLFAIDRARECTRITLVEDVFSAIHLGRGAVALCGTHFSRTQLELLARTEASEVVVCLDRDALEKAWKLGTALAELWSVRVVILKEGKDPDEYDRKTFAQLVDRTPIIDSRASFRDRVEAELRRV